MQGRNTPQVRRQRILPTGFPGNRRAAEQLFFSFASIEPAGLPLSACARSLGTDIQTPPRLFTAARSAIAMMQGHASRKQGCAMQGVDIHVTPQDRAIVSFPPLSPTFS
jgi:hypothetical protein